MDPNELVATDYVHPTKGTIKVFWRWKLVDRPAELDGYAIYVMEPVGIEFDLFVPHEEQVAMIEEIKASKAMPSIAFLDG